MHKSSTGDHALLGAKIVVCGLHRTLLLLRDDTDRYRSLVRKFPGGFAGHTISCPCTNPPDFCFRAGRSPAFGGALTASRSLPTRAQPWLGLEISRASRSPRRPLTIPSHPFQLNKFPSLPV